jgi:hypothetical protein
MDKQPSKKRRLAAMTLSYKDNMESELNKTLPNNRHEPKRWSGSHHVQSAPLTEEFLEPAPIPTLPIAKRGFGSCPAQSAPPSEKLVAPSKPSLHLLRLPLTGRPILGREVSPPRGTIMGSASVDVSPHATTQHWSPMRRLTLRPNGSTRAGINPHRRLCTGDRTLTPSPAHKAAAFVRPSATLRERARRLQLSNASRESWSVWSAIRRLRLLLQRRHPRSSAPSATGPRVTLYCLIFL